MGKDGREVPQHCRCHGGSFGPTLASLVEKKREGEKSKARAKEIRERERQGARGTSKHGQEWRAGGRRHGTTAIVHKGYYNTWVQGRKKKGANRSTTWHKSIGSGFTAAWNRKIASENHFFRAQNFSDFDEIL